MSQASQIQQLQRRLQLYLMLVVLLVATLVAPRLLQWFRSDAAVEPVDTPVVAPRGELADFEETTVDLFRRTSPSVVYINTRRAWPIASVGKCSRSKRAPEVDLSGTRRGTS